jgi:hypothetical protein
LGLVIIGSGGSGDPAGSRTGGSLTTGQSGNVGYLTDPQAFRVAVVFNSLDHEDAFAQLDTATVTPSLFYTNGTGIKWTMSGGAAMERQLVYGCVRLLKGTHVVARALVYTDDNVPAIYFGLFNNNSATALLSAITDGIWVVKAGSALTASCVYQRDSGPVSVASGLNFYLDRFIELSIEVSMDETLAGAGVVTWRMNGQVIHHVAVTAENGLPWDEDLFLTLLSSGNGTIALEQPELSYTTKNEDNT